MAGKINELIKLSNEISEEFNKREFDVLLSSGEQVTCALLSGALSELSVEAKSWMNWQIPILTEGEHSNSRIINMNVEKINEYLDGNVVIMPGFQGISKNGDITTIGEALMQLLWQLPKYSMLIAVKYIQMWMEFFPLTLIKFP